MAVRLEEIAITGVVHAGMGCKRAATQFTVVAKPGL